MAKGDRIWDPAEDIQNEEDARYYWKAALRKTLGMAVSFGRH